MASRSTPNALRSVAAAIRTQVHDAAASKALRLKRGFHNGVGTPTLTASRSRHRPLLEPHHQPAYSAMPTTFSRSRTIFIQTQTTPNADALKFLPNSAVLPTNFPSTFIEYRSPRSTLAPPHPSPLAAKLLAVDGVSSIFYGSDFITVTKSVDANWAHIKPEVFSLITEAVTSVEQIVNTIEKTSAEDGQEMSGEDTLAANDEDNEVVSMIKELLDTRIRPAIQEDGGDIEFRGWKEDSGVVLLKLRGACRTCDSSTVTLKNGIESMLMHYIEEVKSVEQIMDEEEIVSMNEFAKFEERLKAMKGPEAVASSSSDRVEA